MVLILWEETGPSEPEKGSTRTENFTAKEKVATFQTLVSEAYLEPLNQLFL